MIELRGSKRRAVLAVLLLHANEVVRVERLIEDVWGEHSPANAAGALQNHISRLRKDLGEGVLVTKPWGYVLRAQDDEIDLARFERLVAEAKSLAAQERAAMLADALALWRGPAFADLADEPALSVEIARLDDLRVAAVEQRVDADLELGRHEALIPELEGLVAQHPLRERLRGQLILALYRSGRQAEALETYRETRRVLVEELGLEPSAELRELERAILRQDPALASVVLPPVPVRDASPSDQSRWRWPRSPLGAAGALLLLIGVGVAGAVLALHDGGSAGQPPAAEAGATRPAQGTTIVVIETGIPQTRVVTAPHRSRPPQVRRAATQTRTARRVVARPTHVVTTVKKRTVPKGQPTKSTQPYLLADDFNTAALDSRIWHRGISGSGGDLVQRSGRVELGLAANAVGDGSSNLVEAHYGTNCSLIGDFDVRVEFRLLSWPQASGATLTLAAWRSNATSLTLSRFAAPVSEGYVVELPLPPVVGPGTNSIRRPSDDGAGALRLRRRQNFLTAYYRRGSAWEAFGGTPYLGNVIVGLQLSAGADFSQHEVRAAFDNFAAAAAGVACPPGTPRPPRKHA